MRPGFALFTLLQEKVYSFRLRLCCNPPTQSRAHVKSESKYNLIKVFACKALS